MLIPINWIWRNEEIDKDIDGHDDEHQQGGQEQDGLWFCTSSRESIHLTIKRSVNRISSVNRLYRTYSKAKVPNSHLLQPEDRCENDIEDQCTQNNIVNRIKLNYTIDSFRSKHQTISLTCPVHSKIISIGLGRVLFPWAKIWRKLTKWMALLISLKRSEIKISRANAKSKTPDRIWSGR